MEQVKHLSTVNGNKQKGISKKAQIKKQGIYVGYVELVTENM
jgi:hypothetical protein